jgi:hypothetical protein
LYESCQQTLRGVHSPIKSWVNEGHRLFHSPSNQEQLAKLIAHPCLPKPGAKQSAEQESQASIQFRQSRQKHAGAVSNTPKEADRLVGFFRFAAAV